MKIDHYIQWEVELWFCVGDRTMKEAGHLRKAAMV